MYTYRAQRYLIEPINNHGGAITKALLKVDETILEFLKEESNYIDVWLSEHYGIILLLNEDGKYITAKDNLDDLAGKLLEHGIKLRVSVGEEHA